MLVSEYTFCNDCGMDDRGSGLMTTRLTPLT